PGGPPVRLTSHDAPRGPGLGPTFAGELLRGREFSFSLTGAVAGLNNLFATTSVYLRADIMLYYLITTAHGGDGLRMAAAAGARYFVRPAPPGSRSYGKPILQI